MDRGLTDADDARIFTDSEFRTIDLDWGVSFSSRPSVLKEFTFQLVNQPRGKDVLLDNKIKLRVPVGQK